MRRFGLWLHRLAGTGGAAASGLGGLIEVHAAQSAGDALVAVGLAGTLFFAVPTHAARSRVLLYLLITMAPFALVAPVIGPVLDRFRAGRRAAIAVSAVGRGVLALVLAGAVAHSHALTLYPAAFGVLVLSKTYAVSRAAVVPRLLPTGSSLVQANARLSLGGLLPATAAAPIGAAAAAVGGPGWSLRLAVLGYAGAAVLAVRLPGHVDSARGEQRIAGDPQAPLLGRLAALVPSVSRMLRDAAALRALSGFLLLFVAFLVRGHQLSGRHAATTWQLGLLAAAVAVGGLVGTGLGAWVRRGRPERIVTGTLTVGAVSTLAAALFYGLAAVMAVVFVASAAASLSKLALDSVIQRDVEEHVRTSAFGRTETAVQLAWVLGGLVGILLPGQGVLGFGLATVFLAAVLGWRFLPARPGGRRAARSGDLGRAADDLPVLRG